MRAASTRCELTIERILGELSGSPSFRDPGNYVWRPAGSRHDAHSPDGAVVLSFFLKPNKFFDMGGGHIK